MTAFQQIGFIFLLLVVSIAAVDRSEHERTQKSLGIFNVIQFPNTACAGAAGLNGTCYTSDECTAKGGTSSGTCASSFGVCCTFSLACGSTTSENCTYHAIASFNTATDASPCTYTVCPVSSDVCKLRIDFEAFAIAAPFTTAATCPTCTTQTGSIAAMTGDCTTDTFSVSNPGGPSSPTICGTNAGQHIYIDADSACNLLNFNINTLSTSTTRSWNLKVTQHNCGSFPQTSHDCLQYLTGVSGTFSSFNFDTTATTVANGPSMQHLNDQYYDICFRREENYCGICFDPAINTVTTAPSFGVSASKAAGAAQSANEITCGTTTAYADYINVDGLLDPTSAPATSSLTNAAATTAEKICGQIFGIIETAATAVTACSYRIPFRWGVHFDDLEIVLAAGIANLDNHDTAQGAVGFYMNYWQVAC